MLEVIEIYKIILDNERNAGDDTSDDSDEDEELNFTPQEEMDDGKVNDLVQGYISGNIAELTKVILCLIF